MAALFGKAFLRSATLDKAVTGFRGSGIWPFDPNIFSDEDFAAVAVTDQDPMILEEAKQSTEQPGDQQQPLSIENQVTIAPPPDSHQAVPSTSGLTREMARELVNTISPLPKASKAPRVRKAEKAALLTSSPYKTALESKLQQQKPKAKHIQKTKAPTKKGKSKATRNNKKKPLSSSSDEETWLCIVCGELFVENGEWVQCQGCRKWAHEDCSPGTPVFFCQNCESD